MQNERNAAQEQRALSISELLIIIFLEVLNMPGVMFSSKCSVIDGGLNWFSAFCFIIYIHLFYSCNQFSHCTLLLVTVFLVYITSKTIET